MVRGGSRCSGQERRVESSANIHDAWFRLAVGDPTRARSFLDDHLPRSVAALLSGRPPELVSGSFVDEALRQHHSGLLFRVGLKTGGDAFVYIFMEHKGAPIRWRLVQHWFCKFGP